MRLKAISIKEPWATLIVVGAKHFETRSRNTTHRGPIAIHASKRMDQSDAAFATLIEPGVCGGNFFLGCVIAICDLVATHRTDFIREFLSPDELSLGNYDNGRWAWELKYVRRIKPIPAKGMLGLWNWDVPRAIAPLMRS